MPNGFLTTENILDTDTQLLGYPESVYYSGASGVNVDNTNLIISLTGEVGKVYSGINPIVVNNDLNKISANTVGIGVEAPLYFSQDDEEGLVISLSGEYVTPSEISGKLDTSSFEGWQQGQYTNDLTAINEKINEVSAAIPSTEGLATETYVQEQTSGKADKSEIPDVSHFVEDTTLESVSSDIVSQIPSTAGLASEQWVEEQGYLTAHQSLENYYTKDETSGAEQLEQAFANIPLGDEEVNTLVHSNSAEWNEVSSKLDENTFQEASGLFLTAIPQEYITESDIPNFISAKLDTTSFADVSGTFLTAHQSLEGYATEQFVENVSGDITALIPTDYYPDNNPSGFITGVDLSNYYQKNETSSKEEISAAIAAIPLGDEEVNQAVHTNSATWNSVTDKLDTTSFSDVSSTFLTAVDLTPYQTIEGMTAYQPVGDYATTTQVNDLSGAIDYVSANAGDQEVHNIVHTNSATWDSVTNKLDTTAFSDVSGSFLTAHQDLSDYYTKSQTSGADELAQAFSDIPLGDEEVNSAVHELSGTWNEVSSKLDTTAFSDVSGTFLTAHQAISAEEWNSNYETVNTNSGAWGGDALPITGRDGIDLEIDNGTLYIGASAMTGSIDYIQTNSANIDEVVTNYQTASGTYLTAHQQISAGPGIDVQLVNDTLVFSAVPNETVLFFAGDTSSGVQTGELTESIKNFERIRVAGMDNDGHVDVKYLYPSWTKDADNLSGAERYEVLMYGANPYSVQSTVWEKWTRYSFSALTSFNIVLSYEGSYTANSISDVTNNHKTSIRKVVGINRIGG